MCPGKLVRDCRTVLAAARSDLFDLASTGNIRLSQRGKTVKPQELKGPFRVRCERPSEVYFTLRALRRVVDTFILAYRIHLPGVTD